MHKWVDAEYTGTKVSISEYGWGDPKKPNDALAEADVLGIFGRERVDLACLWTAPKAADPMANAFRLYRNYDGHGGTFGDTGVRSSSDDQATVSVYAAVRSNDGAMTVVAINKTDRALTCRVTVSGSKATAVTAAFCFGGGQRGMSAAVIPKLAGGGFDAALPGKSAAVYVLK
jgi:O-glycosyl hydrolase